MLQSIQETEILFLVPLYKLIRNTGNYNMDLTKIKQDRFNFLNKLYIESNGSQNAVFSMHEMGRELGFDSGKTSDVVNYLRDEGLINSHGLGGTIKISHEGIKEVEQAHNAPEKPTEHFAPINHIHINSTGNGNVINTGNSNNFTLSNSIEKRKVEDKAEEIIYTLRNDLSLAKAEKEAAIVVFSQLIEESRSGTPVTSTVERALAIGANVSSVGSLVISLFQLIFTKN
ncbi:hypothetical protein HQN86_08550 [Pedobacter panaciterrae]|uniref:hypothetical protein n=1 Tax=Pedobacter panaciterrae TaxID=363849 RepID=UPI00155DCA10|nr:hypothetical protein [Pedobacter panaciterrae]NQX53660.1 hypothetical protein [Pedobacter panaciterrae]